MKRYRGKHRKGDPATAYRFVGVDRSAATTVLARPRPVPIGNCDHCSEPATHVVSVLGGYALLFLCPAHAETWPVPVEAA